MDFCLGNLARVTQHPEGRSRLAESSLLRELADYLPAAIEKWHEEGQGCEKGAQEDLVNLLRVFRNVCACSSAGATRLVEAGVQEAVAAIILESEAPQLTKVAAQMLANLSGAGKAHAAAVWGAAWSDVFQSLVERHSGLGEGPLCMILHNCCSASEALAAELMREESLPVMLPFLEQFSHPQDIGDAHLEMLVTLLSFQMGSLPALSTSFPSSPQNALTNLREWHAGVLHVVSQAVDTPGLASLKGIADSGRGDDLAVSILHVVDSLAKQRSNIEPIGARFLQSGLKFLRSVSARDDDGAGLAGGRPITSLLVSCHGLIKKLLAMLSALGPLQRIRPDKPQPKLSWPENTGLLAEEYTDQLPYEGFRTDIVAVLANAVHQRKAAQEEVQRLGGVELVLSHCQVSDDNPFLREAALWAVRNLCEDNVSIQRQIEELQVVDTVETPQLQEAGMELQHDPSTGKIRLINSVNGDATE